MCINLFCLINLSRIKYIQGFCEFPRNFREFGPFRDFANSLKAFREFTNSLITQIHCNIYKSTLHYEFQIVELFNQCHFLMK